MRIVIQHPPSADPKILDLLARQTREVVAHFFRRVEHSVVVALMEVSYPLGPKEITIQLESIHKHADWENLRRMIHQFVEQIERDIPVVFQVVVLEMREDV